MPAPSSASPSSSSSSGRASRDARPFTDDDCEPHEDWAERLVEPLESNADAVGGRTVGANPTAVGEDREWCDRLLRSGRVLRYEPSAVLVHRDDSDLRSFLRNSFGTGVERSDSDASGPSRVRSSSHGSMPGWCGVVSRRGPTGGTVVCVAQLTTAAGFAAEWRRRDEWGERRGANPLRCREPSRGGAARRRRERRPARRGGAPDEAALPPPPV